MGLDSVKVLNKVMKNINCPLCDKDEFEIVYPEKLNGVEQSFDFLKETPARYRIVKCSKCGMVYSNPIYEEDKIATLYKECDIDNYITSEEQKVIRSNMKRYLDRLLKFSKVSRGKILDVGRARSGRIRSNL